MGRKSRGQKSSPTRNNARQPKNQGRRQMLLWSGGAFLTLAGLGGYFLSSLGIGSEEQSVTVNRPLVDYIHYQLKEQRPTLSPRFFRGKAAEAYQVAQEIPKVLDQLYCYCRCKENFGHKSLLTCYVDKHASL